MVNQAGEHIATIGFNEACGLWQIVIVQSREVEFFCPTREVAFAAWREEFESRDWISSFESQCCIRFLNGVSFSTGCNFSLESFGIEFRG